MTPGSSLSTTVAVVGITSQVAPALVNHLRHAGYRIIGFSRSGQAFGDIAVHRFDCTPTHLEGRVETLVNLTPLPLIDEVLQLAQRLGATRLIAFGSTGIFSKAASSSALEREFVASQLDAEARLQCGAEERGINWTLFRPTMIYGAGTDQNVTFIQNTVRRFGFFPLPFGRSGLRQPVHVDDLARACVQAIDNLSTYDRAYNLAGGEVLTYREMVSRIFRSRRMRTLLLPIPAPLFRLLVKLASRLPGLAYLRPEMVDRMRDDLVADNTDAARDFGYSPRGFEPPPA
ncbi:MAG: NAD-dependent epimerase/dehydratase family protein [Pseudomonadales bacterium]